MAKKFHTYTSVAYDPVHSLTQQTLDYVLLFMSRHKVIVPSTNINLTVAHDTYYIIFFTPSSMFDFQRNS